MTCYATYQEAIDSFNEPEQKPKKLKLKEFESVMFESVGVNVIEVPYQDNETGNTIIAYRSSLVVWLTSKKYNEFPIVIELSIENDGCDICMAHRTLMIANDIADEVKDTITFVDCNGKLIKEMSISKVVALYEEGV